MDAFRKWLTIEENRDGIPCEKITSIKEELLNQEIGMRLSNKFTITYSMLWNVSGLYNTCLYIYIHM